MKKSLVGFAAAMVLMSAATASQVTTTLDYSATVRAARQALSTGSAESALPYLEKALRMDPSKSEAFSILGETYLQIGRFRDAATVLARGIRLLGDGNPAAIPMLKYMAFALHRDERDSAAIETLERVLRVSPGTRNIHLILGRIHLGAGKYESAAEEFRLEIALYSPEESRRGRLDGGSPLASAMAGLGVATYRIGDDAAAISILSQVPTMESRYFMGLALARSRKHEEAAVQFREVLEMNPVDRGALQNLALCLSEMGREDERNRVLRRLQAVYEGEQQAQSLKVRIGNEMASARHKLSSGESQVATEQLARAASMAKEYVKYMLRIGRLQYEAGDREAGLETFLAVQGRQPLNPESYYWLGRIRADQGHAEEAVALLTRALQLSPVNARYRAELARIRFEAGEKEAALDELKLGIEISPEDANAYYYLGVGLARSGDLAGAAATLQTAVELDRDRPKPGEALARKVLRLVGEEQVSDRERKVIEDLSAMVTGAS